MFSLVCGTLIFGCVVWLVCRHRLQERYAILWLVLAIAFMTYGWWLAPVAALAEWLRIGDVVPMVLFFGVFLCALLILQLSVKSSEFSHKIRNLTQELALLRHELERRAPSHRAPSGSDAGPDAGNPGEAKDATP